VPDYTSFLGEDIKGLRVGVIRGYFFDGVDSEVKSAVNKAIGVLESLGVRLEEVTFPRIQETVAASTLILSAEASAYHERYLRTRPQDYDPAVRERLELGRMILASDYVNAQRLRGVVSHEYAEMFERVDVLVTAVCPIPAPRQDEFFMDVNGERRDVRIALASLTRPFNVVGAPSLCLPCGFTSGGLPVAFQVAGRLFDEATLLRVGYAYQQATSWQQRRPPV
jgi:Asp-tRNA(Asn)/Glu-tRNA(Gln) amidotransferase A subunit family amidase